ncbi:MAG TPA: hypothetical protein PK095_00175 [Myxococcota bacterium]|nr:hypothetical protein [Myxococcota bacterium]
MADHAGADRVLRAIREWCGMAMSSRRAMRIAARAGNRVFGDIFWQQPAWFGCDVNELSEAARSAIDAARWEFREGPTADMDAQGVEAFSELPDPQREAALDLWAVMSDISEDCWCAGWVSGNEMTLWRMVTDPKAPRHYGQSGVSDAQVEAMTVLSRLSQSWWEFREDDQGTRLVWVPLETWKCLYAEATS